MDSQSDVQRVKEFHKETILKMANVVGLGTGFKEIAGRVTEDLCVVVLVRQKVPRVSLDPQDLVPSKIEGVLTDVVQVGELRALQTRTGRWRPAPGGVSIGHFKISAGTLGTVVRDRDTDARLILSNNHVMANSNDAEPGDPILQPGAADGGRLRDDTLAVLERFVPLNFSVSPPDCPLAIGVAEAANVVASLLGSKHRLQALQVDPAATNLVDAAVARPTEEDLVLDEILELGVVRETEPASLGMDVRKSGRTTGLTTGKVTVLNATVNVTYDQNRVARFEDQIVSGPMSQGGDSGSLLVAGDSLRAVGLLFGGSNEATIFNPIQAVLDSLKVVL
ncbi:MAG: hypothetical protein GTO14_13230 [Anaerolineales bacterium]|nr:hypothetical protein [Anaerolineales bacterium]